MTDAKLVSELRHQILTLKERASALEEQNRKLIERIEHAEDTTQAQVDAATDAATARVAKAKADFEAALEESHARRKEAGAMIKKLQDELASVKDA